MLRINGIFSTGKVKQTNKGTKYLNVSNMDKDQYGNKNYTYYTLWLTDKVSNMFPTDIKRKIGNNGALVVIEGYLKIEKKDSYTNLTIIPSEIKEFNKS